MAPGFGKAEKNVAITGYVNASFMKSGWVEFHNGVARPILKDTSASGQPAPLPGFDPPGPLILNYCDLDRMATLLADGWIFTGGTPVEARPASLNGATSD
jgi:hypothetical protein